MNSFNRGTVVLIESSDIGARYSAEAIKALGYEPLFLCDLADYHADPLAQIQNYPHLQCHTTSAESVISTLNGLKTSELIGITSFVDSRLTVAVEVAERLGLRGLDPQILKLKNKGLAYTLTPEYSPASLVFRPSDMSPQDHLRLAQLFRRAGKLILKPSAGAGAIGIFTVTSELQLTQIQQTIASKNVPDHFVHDEWMAQAYIPGELVSLEGYVVAGKTTTLGFTNRVKVHATESRASFPVDESLKPRQRAKALQAVHALVQRSGFRNGYFHIEFLLSGDDAVLIDANMGRLGGGPVGELLALSYGVDPIAIYEHALEVCLFGKESHSPYVHAEIEGKKQGAHSVLYGLEHGGDLLGVSFPSHARVYHTQLLDRGTHASPMGTDDWSWIGIVSGLESDTEAAVRGLKISTSSGEFPACY